MGQNIIVSLTTIPPRYHLLNAVIESLVNQTLQPFKIELNIPKAYRNPKYGKASGININSAVDIYECSKDWGPATKLLPTLERYWGSTVLIFYVDDDRIYRRDLLERLVAYSEHNLDNTIAAHSVSVKRQLIEAHWKERPLAYRFFRSSTLGLWNPKRAADKRPEQIAEGFGGVLTRPSFFNKSIFQCPDHLSSVDDVWISGCLTATGHAPIRCPSVQPSTRPHIENSIDIGHLDGLAQNSQYGMDRFQANAACIEYMRSEFNIWQNP